MNLVDEARRLVPNVCEDLLASTGHRPKKRAAGDIAPLIARPQEYAAGVVDFGGDTMSGSLVFATAVGFVAQCLADPGRWGSIVPSIGETGRPMTGRPMTLRPDPLRPPDPSPASLRPRSAADWIRVRDWSMEMTNQLLGRVKNRMRKLGVVVEPYLPRAVSGHALLVTVRARTTKPIAYVVGGHDVFVWFETAVAKDAPSSPSQTDTLEEGDVVEF